MNPGPIPASKAAEEGEMLTMVALVASGWAADRGAIGVGVGGGISPFEPSFVGAAGPAGSVTLDLELWAIYGGEDRRGPRGRLVRGADPQRIGLVCEGGFNQGARVPSQHGGCGLGYGGQWGSAAYLTAWSAVGIGAYSLFDLGADGRRRSYTSVGPWLRPKLAVGLQPFPGLAVEAGPYASIVLPLSTAFHNAIPEGRYVGQVGIEVTTLFGSSAP